MITRDAGARLRYLATLYPVVSVTGPRQSGKTTLCRATFPDHPYVSLEPLDVREFAIADPRGFLASLPRGGQRFHRSDGATGGGGRRGKGEARRDLSGDLWWEHGAVTRGNGDCAVATDSHHPMAR